MLDFSLTLCASVIIVYNRITANYTCKYLSMIEVDYFGP